MTVLVDSDILIEVSRRRNESVLSKWRDLSKSDTPIFYSSISTAELWAGALPSEFESLTILFKALICVSADADVGRRAGDYLRQYKKSHGLELGDAFIAASAVAHNAALWTRNRKHYPMKELTFFA